MLDIALDADPEWDRKSDWDRLVHRAAEAAVLESAFPQLASSPRPAELSVRLARNEDVQELNASWRGEDRPTNVLSFPLAEAAELADVDVDGPELMLGDIILAHGVCAAEASEKGISVEQHAAHLIIHGTLHLIGHDHHDEAEAVDMEAREVRALARLGIADPYEGTA